MIETPTYMLIRLKVRDFHEWKKSYDTFLTERIEAGLTEKFLFQDFDDSNDVIILFEARDLAHAKAFTESQDLREKMREGGVIGNPDFYFLNIYSEAVAQASGF